MKITCLQMDMQLGCPDENFLHAQRLIKDAVADKPDVIVLPETWNTGFFPQNSIENLCDRAGERVKREIGQLSRQYQVNIVAGSVSDVRDGKIFNTVYVFDRTGSCIASYDKTHLFSPMGEEKVYTPGNHVCRFLLDGVSCGVITCYDIRFPELTRTLVMGVLDVLFIVCQWPHERIEHLRTLSMARAIENQMFVICCNSCATAYDTVFGGNSLMVDPWGTVITEAGESEQLLHGILEIGKIQDIRQSINVFRDRRPELYKL